MRVVVAVENFPMCSETFIQRHIDLLDADLFARRLVRGDVASLGVAGHVVAGEHVSDVRESLPAKILRRSHEVFIGPVRPRWPRKMNRLWREYVRARKPDVALAEFGPVGMAVAPFCRESEIPLVVHFHGYDASSALHWPGYSGSLPELFDTAAAVVVVSQMMRGRLESVGCPGDKLHVIPCGAPLDLFSPSAETLRQPCRFLSVARFIPGKGHLLTLRAYARCLESEPEIRLTMIGEGPLLSEAQALAGELGISDSVHFPGARPITEVRQRMSESSVFVQHSITSPSGWVEGWGVSLAEAAATGLPVIATKNGGIPDQVIDGETGYLVAEKDWEAMARKMAVLARDPALRHTLGQAARKNIEQVGNLETQVRKLRDVLEGACSRPASGAEGASS